MIQPTINQINKIVRQAAEDGQLNPRMKAIAVESNQKYVEYLDRLMDGPLPIDESITVQLDGKQIRFPSFENFAEWLSDNIQ